MIETKDEFGVELSKLEGKVSCLAEMFTIMSFQDDAYFAPEYMSGLAEIIQSAIVDHVKLLEKDYGEFEKEFLKRINPEDLVEGDRKQREKTGVKTKKSPSTAA